MFAKFLKLPQAGNLIILFLGLIFIWFIAPYIPVGNSFPFASASARGILTAVFTGGYLLKLAIQWVYKYRSESWNKLCEAWNNLKEHTSRYWQASKEYGKQKTVVWQERWQNDQNRRLVKRTPWYLVWGSPKSGKYQLIHNSGLRMVQAESYGAQGTAAVKQFDSYEWYFSDEAIFVDIASAQTDNADALEKRFLKFLRRQSKAKPLSGVVFTFSLPELILAQHEVRRDFIQHFAGLVKNLYKQLHTPVPVYIAFTKCDLVSGFTEFFTDLSKEDLTQVWGITFPLNDSSKPEILKEHFNHEFNQLLARLQQRVLWAMDIEKNQRDRNLIHGFPQQMQLFKNPIAMLIGELFAALPNKEMLQLRGTYLTSARQEGEAYDFFLHAINKHYNIKSSMRIAQEPHNESYFLQRLFYDVLIPESKVLGFSERARHLKGWLYRGACTLIPASVLGIVMCLHYGYVDNQRLVQQVQNNLDQYSQSVKDLAVNDLSIPNTLPALNALHRAEVRLGDRASFSHLLLASHLLKSNATAALNRSLHSLFLPRVAAGLEADLETNRLSINNLYADLKGYLAFSPSNFTIPEAIRAPMEIKWANDFSDKPNLEQQLRYYLRRASKMQLDQLPLNRPLINKVRLQLQQVIPARRAYALLTIRAMAGDVTDINFATVIGAQFKHMFSYHGHNTRIPALYTKAGFDKVFKPGYETITQQVANDNREIGLDAKADTTQDYDQIVLAMQQEYQKRYIAAWQQFLANTDITHVSNYTQAEQVFGELGSDHSALKKVLNIVYANTAEINSDNVNVSTSYLALNNFSSSGLSGSKLDKTLALFKQLSAYFAKLNNSANPNQAAFKAAVTYMQGDANNPIRQMSILAETAPKPLNKWLKEVADNSWQLVLKGALGQINKNWQAEVLPEYQRYIAGRYPLNANSRRELDISRFVHFFGKNGTLTKFYQQYLQPFVDDKGAQWKLYRSNGHALELSKADLNAFQRLHAIQDRYFDQNSGQPSLNFTVTPAALSSNSSRSILNMGNKQLSYAHGPQRPVAVQWPLPEGMQQSKLLIRDFHGRAHVFRDFGPWSIYRLFERGHIHQAKNGNGYIFGMSMGGHSASFKVATGADLSAFQLVGLRHFHLPNAL